MISFKSRLLFLSVLFAASLASAGCSGPAFAFTGRISIQEGGVMRTALIVQHERLKKSRRAVIIVLHGGARLRHNFEFEDIILSSSPVMVYPNALEGAFQLPPSALG